MLLRIMGHLEMNQNVYMVCYVLGPIRCCGSEHCRSSETRCSLQLYWVWSPFIILPSMLGSSQECSLREEGRALSTGKRELNSSAAQDLVTSAVLFALGMLIS